MPKPFYITTTLPYVNAKPHIGFALEIVYADILARYHTLLGDEVFFNTGTDEHGQKLYQNARAVEKTPQEYVDGFAQEFKTLIPRLGILSEIHFIRTTDTNHKAAAQEFWKRCDANGDIYKKTYKVKYCVGCELEKTDSELLDGYCPLHPGKELELIEEENYFFKFEKYQPQLLALYDRVGHDFVVPKTRLHEIREFVSAGLKDFSISRLASKMPWGIPVPGDDTQVMYVWFDALINYISTLGWPEVGSRDKGQGTSRFEKFWGTQDAPNGVQIAGKDNLRQQSAMWQAMLMSAGVPNSKQILIHGFITSGGQKMSKSIGNVVDPFEIIDRLVEKGVAEEQAIDALRYWFAREMPTFEDGDFTWEKFVESYNANLANGLGNLVSRVLKMAVNAGIADCRLQTADFDSGYKEYLSTYEIQKAADWVWKRLKGLDEYIAEKEPFKTVKVNPEEGKKQISYLLEQLAFINFHLQAIVPNTSEKIEQALIALSPDAIPRLFARVEV
ncbi:MAG: methionine--tRNA ligase [Candidatus Doudnabacteria bacterium]|nr:methionine--tRNA ligase [Candidatus Doudnabacteria bacterium]